MKIQAGKSFILKVWGGFIGLAAQVYWCNLLLCPDATYWFTRTAWSVWLWSSGCMTQIASSAKSNYERFVCFVYRVITLSYFLIFLEIFRLNKIFKHPKMTSCSSGWSWFKGFCSWLPSLKASPDNLFTNRMLPHWYERITSVIIC